MIGKKVFVSYPGMTLTSGNGEVRKTYVIRERTLNGYKAELIRTNASMYSGSGVFKEFSKEDLNCESLPYQYNIEVEA
jgi:hypothetical protein